MTTDTSKKVDFIVTWYNKERVNFSFAKQIVLAKDWIDICAKNEEYEMSSALNKEMNKVSKEYIKKKRKNRPFEQKCLYFYIKIKRMLKL